MTTTSKDDHDSTVLAVWKSVEVSIERRGIESKDTNHYDNKKLEQRANQELQVTNPAEDVGMFYGLEVIDGSNYTVEINNNNTKTFRVKGEEKKQQGRGGPAQTNKTKKKKKKKEQQQPREKVAKEATTAEDGLLNKELQPVVLLETGREKKGKKRKRNEKVVAAAATLCTSSSPATAQQHKSESANASSQRNDRLDDESLLTTTNNNNDDQLEEDVSQEDKDVSRLENAWMMATGGVILHPNLCRALVRQKFWTPTPIQAATLPAAILGRRNLVGAAPTGSGKTLAYLLPILQYLLSELDNDDDNNNNSSRFIKALILLPTRELALQVVKECEKLLTAYNNNNNNKKHHLCGIFVGGLAEHKQSRVLIKQRPPIVIGTPGRLWKLMSSGEYIHLNHLNQIKYLVMDEADRMIQQGSFPQLKRILEAVSKANPMTDSSDEEDSDDDEEEEDDRMLGLPGIPGEAKVQMLGDVLERLQRQQQQQDGDDFQPPVEMEDDEYEETNRSQDDDDDEDSLPHRRPPVQRQTFIYSATLTLPSSTTPDGAKSKSSRRKKTRGTTTVDGALAELLERSHAKGLTKVVDLTSCNKFVVTQQKNHHQQQTTVKQVTTNNNKKRSNKEEDDDDAATSTNNSTAGTNHKQQQRLPPGLELHEIKCTQKHKDSHLYAFLVTTTQGSSGPCLIFCNSIAAVKRVGSMLQTLRLPVKMLHANMPQKARFKAVESLSRADGSSRSIVVATDVAARGLDIPSVATVIHYDVARQVDIFVHRAGRTARGVGEKAVGCSVSLVAPNEDKAHGRICSILGSKSLFSPVQMDGRLLSEAQERVHLATKIVTANDMESKTQRQNQWFVEAAKEAQVDLDEEDLASMLEGSSSDQRRDQGRFHNAQHAKSQLRVLLSRPMKTQRFGKFFLSTNGGAAAAEKEISSFGVSNVMEKGASRASGKRKRRRRRH